MRGIGPKIPFATPTVEVSADPTPELAPAEKLGQVAKADVEAFLEARTQRMPNGPSTFQRVFRQTPKVQTLNEANRKQLLLGTPALTAEIGRALTEGASTESQAVRASTAFGRIEQILGLEDPPVLALLPPDVRDRLEHNLFAPLKVLRQDLAAVLQAAAPQAATAESQVMITTRHDVARAQPFALRFAGNVETKGIETFETSTLKAAVFTNKGIGYADYDEDAASIRVIPGEDGAPDTVLAVVSDQAGGGDHLKREGAASEAAVSAWEDAVAGGATPAAGLKRAGDAVDELNRAERKSSLATLSGISLTGLKPKVASAGDSQVLVYSKDGRLKHRSVLDNQGAELAARGEVRRALGRPASTLTNVLGQGMPPLAHADSWPDLEPGDVVILCSDGVGDMNLEAQANAYQGGYGPSEWKEWHSDSTEREIGEFVAAGKDPEEIARSILTQVFANVRSGDGKPDNTTLMVLQMKG